MKKVLLIILSACILSCAGWQKATKTAIDASVKTMEASSKIVVEFYRMKCGLLAQKCAANVDCDKYLACKEERREVFTQFILAYKEMEKLYALYNSYLAQDKKDLAGKILADVLKLIEKVTSLLKSKGIM